MNKNKNKTKTKKENWKCNHAASFNIGLSSAYALFSIHSRKKMFKCWKRKMRARFKPIDFSYGLQFHLSLDSLTSPSVWVVFFFLSFLFNPHPSKKNATKSTLCMNLIQNENTHISNWKFKNTEIDKKHVQTVVVYGWLERLIKQWEQ